MAEGGEPLGQAVKTQNNQHQRAEGEAERVEFCCGENRQNSTHQKQGPSLRFGNECMPVLGPLVEFVKIPVHEPVEAHGQRTGGDCTNKNPAENPRSDATSARREHRDQAEGKRENCVGKANESSQPDKKGRLCEV